MRTTKNQAIPFKEIVFNDAPFRNVRVELGLQ